MVPLVHQIGVGTGVQIEGGAKADGIAVCAIGAAIKENRKIGTAAGRGNLWIAASVGGQFGPVAKTAQDIRHLARVFRNDVLCERRQRADERYGEAKREFLHANPQFFG